MEEKILDFRGRCNFPALIIDAKRLLKTLMPGDRICILTFDPNAINDIKAFCKFTKNELVGMDCKNKEYKIIIRKHS
jgi:TusA-related sulfurtransferase